MYDGEIAERVIEGEDVSVATADSDGSAAPRQNAASRMLSVLEVFRQAAMPVTLSDISRISGLPMTTAHRLTHELLAWNALERTDDGRYRLGTKMLELVTASTHAMELRERALPWLVRLHQTLRNIIVHLAIRDGDESVFIEALHSSTRAARMNRLGGRMPLTATATGRVLLAWAPEEVQERVLSASQTAFTSETLVEPEELRRELQAIRQAGTSITRSQVIAGSGGIGAPVFDPEGDIVASVGIVFRLKDFRLEEYVPIVEAAARKISRDIGVPGLIIR